MVRTTGDGLAKPVTSPNKELRQVDLIGPPTTGFPQLYHYESFNAEWLRQTIVGKRLYLSNPARFNDPWDCQPHFNSGAANDPAQREKHVQYYIRVTRKHGGDLPEQEVQRRAQALRDDPNFLRFKIEEFSREFPKAIDRRYRIYCLSTKPDSERMWAHYAAQHKGICLEFTSRSDLFFQALKVTYLRYYPVFDMADDDDTMPLMVLLTKSRAWKYEDEYRLIAQERGSAAADAESPLITDDNLLALPDGSLKAVILGWLASEGTVAAVQTIIREASYPILLKRAVKAPNRYRLVMTAAS